MAALLLRAVIPGGALELGGSQEQTVKDSGNWQAGC